MTCYRKIVVLIFVLLLLPGGSVSAGKLTVILIGTGEGEVEGEDIFCSPLCDYDYEKGTVVQLKAYPDDDSTFEGWLVNGEPHEGVITINQEDILVTAKFNRKTPADKRNLMWYNGNSKEYATLALDEIAIFLYENPEDWFAFKEEFAAILEDIAPLFHPQIELFQWGPLAIVLKSPEPFSQEQLPEIIEALKTHEAIRQAGPVLYEFLDEPDSQIIPVDELSVVFPESYTEAKISAIKQKYGLVTSVKPDSALNPVWFQVDSPLAAIDIANQLYESGLVESSYPGLIKRARLLNQLLEEEFLDAHWHFRDVGLRMTESTACIVDIR